MGGLGHLGDTVQNLFPLRTDCSRRPGNLLCGGTLLLDHAEIAPIHLDLADQKLGVDLLSKEVLGLWKYKVAMCLFTPISAASERAVDAYKYSISSIWILRGRRLR